MRTWRGAARTTRIVLAYVVVYVGMLPALLWATGGRLDEILSIAPVGTGGRIAGVALLAVGAAGLVASVVGLATRGRGWPISHLPPARLVTAGPYRVVRHPLYASFVVAFAGLGLAAGSWGRGVGAPGLLAAGATIYALGFEEPGLRSRYGDDWAGYRQAVPGSLPGGGLPAGLRERLGRAWAALVPRLERLADRTVLFRLGGSVWVTYGALLAMGAAVMCVWLSGLLARGGFTPLRTGLFLVGLSAAMLGTARVAWLGYHVPGLVRDPVRTLRTVGFVSWGALLGLAVFGVAYAGATGVGARWLLDRLLLTALPLMVLGRVGCIAYGCCYGKPWEGGIRWRSGDARVVREKGPAGRVPRIPTQLVEAAGALVLLVPAVVFTSTSVPSGAVACLVVLLYGLLRFGSDCLRDEPRFTRWELTAGQLASVGTAAVAWTALFFLDGPPGWARPAWELQAGDLLRGLPGAAAATFLVFAVCGFHWRRVGRW